MHLRYGGCVSFLEKGHLVAIERPAAARASRSLLRRSCLSTLAIFTCLSACSKKEEKKAQPAPAVVETVAPVDTRPTQINLDGPRPPEVSAVFFGVNGALIPLACYDAAAKKMRGGAECGKLAASGSEVYLASETGALLDSVGAPKNALCEIGSEPTSLSSSILDTGAAYDFATWPRPFGALVRQIPIKTTVPKTAALDDSEKTAVLALLEKLVKGAKGELRSNQKVKMDVDGDGQEDWLASVTMLHPSEPDQTLFSGVLFASGGDLSKIIVVDASQRRMQESLIYRGLVDLNGDGKNEFWLSISFEGGSGERIVALEGGKPMPLGKWSCGA
jgi:hypothetical protein